MGLRLASQMKPGTRLINDLVAHFHIRRTGVANVRSSSMDAIVDETLLN